MYLPIVSARRKVSTLQAFLISLALGMLFNIAALAQTPEKPQTIIENASNRIKLRLNDGQFRKNFNQVVDFVDSVIDPHIDFDLVSSLVLGKFWKTATDMEKTRFKKEFKTLLIRTYARAFVELDSWEIEFLPAIEKTDGNKILIKTKAKQPGRQAVAVDYRMLERGGEWKVYDILIDGVSLVTTYRSSFKNDIDAMGALSPVIDKIAKKNAESASRGSKE